MIVSNCYRRGALVLILGAIPVIIAGCRDSRWNWNNLGFKSPAPPEFRKVPPPIDLLLPRVIRIHPFTGTRTFDESGGVKGIDVRIEALDSYGDATKAFGDFRFELYAFLANNPDPKGKRLSTWEVPLLKPKVNLTHWDNITRTYEFKLLWDDPIPVGERFVLVAVFSSPFGERRSDQRVFTSGQ